MYSPMEQPIVIIGGGLMGVSTLYELAAQGRRAILLEAETALGLGASFANGGVLHPSLPDPWNNPGIGGPLLRSLFSRTAAMKLHWRHLPALTTWGMTFLRHSTADKHWQASRANYHLAAFATEETKALSARLQLTYDNRPSGMMKVYRSARGLKQAAAFARRLQGEGLQVESLSPDQMVARDPQLADAASQLAGALVFDGDYIGDARAFLLALAQQGEKLGGDIRCGARVTRLLHHRGTVTGVEVSENGALSQIDAQVVLCNGHQADQLTRPLGLKLPVRPGKGYSITLDASHVPDLMPHHPIVDAEKHISITPLGNRLRLLGTAEFNGDDTSLNQTRLETLRQFFRQFYPTLASQLDIEAGDCWAGLRPMSADGKPFIGASPLDGLWLNVGHGHLGWTMAVGSAKLLTHQMLNASGQETTPLPSPLDPTAFSASR